MLEERCIAGKRCLLCGEEGAGTLLLQPADRRELSLLEEEAAQISRLAPGKPFLLLGYPIGDWQGELSPWPAPPVFGREPFGGGAGETLRFLEAELLLEQERVFLGGYSLSGLFALWAAYRSERFRGVAAVSPSVWFPGWEEYSSSRRCLSPLVYLSLGDREEKTKNPVMARVGDVLRRQYERLTSETRCTLEWNEGNHFKDPALRTARGFAWLLRQ